MGRKPLHRPWIRSLIGSSIAAVVAVSCTHAPPPKAASPYTTLPLKKVPPFMGGTLFERVDVINPQATPVSAYGLVAHLRNTGDCNNVPSRVREWMNKQLIKRGFGQLHEGLGEFNPEAMLNDPSFAIVRVDGFIPPGTRKNQTFDVMVSAPADSTTSSLAHGQLYDSNLGANGANPADPNVINVFAIARGPIFVNPAYSTRNTTKSEGAANSLRYGVVMDGGHALSDWPIVLRLRQPQMAMARAIDNRINQRFQGIADKKRQNDKGYCVAEARDEGTICIWVPASYQGDWEHLIGIITHLYTDGSPENTVLKARMLADEAVKPDAKLLDISYAWEGLGEKALPFIQPLMISSKQDVAFAAARAAAFLGDASAVDVLIRMAGTSGHEFQLNATEVLGTLPKTQQITHALRQLVDTQAALVRLEAYRILARQNDPAVFSTVIDEKFVLDIVKSSGPPLIYASRQGIPRIAIIGNRTDVQTPITFTAMNQQLSITSSAENKPLTIFYRGQEVRDPLTVLSHSDVAELVARLGGEPHNVKDRLNFSYGDILGILQSMADQHDFYATSLDGKQSAAAFVLQEVTGTQNEVLAATVNSPDTTSSAADGALPDLIPKDQNKRPLNDGSATGARPQ